MSVTVWLMAAARFTGWEAFVHPLPGLRAARSKLGFKLAPAFAGCEVQLNKPELAGQWLDKKLLPAFAGCEVQLRRRFLTCSITE